jgi:putative flippase GtrA
MTSSMEPRRKNAFKSQELPRTTPNDPQGDDNNDYDDDDQLRKHQNATVLSRTIHWMESKEVPACIARRLRRNYNSTSGENNLFIITGLGKVFYGTQPAAEAVRIAGICPPRYLCYMISGSGCDIIQFLFYVLFYRQLNDASMCWALSFGSSVVFRHTTHRYLVFGDYVGGYWRSLGRMYAGYSIIIVLSTLFNIVITKYMNMPHVFAWILTMLWTGIVNYFILKKLWSFDGSNKKEDDAKYRGLPNGDSLDKNDIELCSNKR